MADSIHMRKALGIDDHGAEENTASFEVYPAAQDLAAANLAGLRVQLLDHLLPFLRGYIWQRERFSLHLSTEQQAPWQRKHTAARSWRRRGVEGAGAASAPLSQPATPPHLWGSVSFGDNVEDEWFIVWLLQELTRVFPVTARAWDNDGEFLLIEAAYGLPRWLKPETAQNRVWLHGGAFHLVPLPRSAGEPLLSAAPSLTQALALVRGAEIDTAAPPKMQVALLQRVSGFPARAAQLMHVAHVLVPARVALLLAAEPQLLASAVEAFHYRDPDDVKAASKMAIFPPRDMVLAAPTFSRCLYAQLVLQEFAPPRGYPMPMPSDPQYRAAEVGLKLTAGFEMVCANHACFGRQEEGAQESGQGAGQAGQAAATSGQADESSLVGDAGWAAFKARLQTSGYFHGHLPGSTQHSQLLQAAVESYRRTDAYRRGNAALAAPALRINVLLQQEVDCASFPTLSKLPPQGSEAWLQEQAGQQLELELEQRQHELAQQQQHAQRRQQPAQQQQQQQPGGGGKGGGKDGGFDPRELAVQLRAFVDMVSGLEGAEVPTKAAGAASEGGGGAMALDEAAFAVELQKVLGLTRVTMRHAGHGSEEESDALGTSSEEGSSFFSDDASSQSDLSDAEEEQQPGLRQQQPRQAAAVPAAPASARGAAASAAAWEEEERRRQEGWEADTATDSDDDARFMDAYGQAMDRQLAGTHMAESFEQARVRATAAGNGGETRGSQAAPAAADRQAGEVQQQQQEEQDEAGGGEVAARLLPVDLDVNLVKSLLASYGEQQGLPGPTGSLAGLMGVRLPPPQSLQ